MDAKTVPGLIIGTMCLLGATFVACVDENVVFRDRPLFDEPPTGAAQFLGYSVTETKLTTCGNCHVGKQAEWAKTAHADAWSGLQLSGHAQESCEACHTVNELGNPTEEDGGWVATQNARYQDVQCESCHGPGLGHVQNPDASQPLASILVGTELEAGCGECHQGTHNPFVEEWSQSRHGDMTSFPQTREGCVACHEMRGVFAAWGIKADYTEKEQGQAIPITCAVCHDPHDATNPKQLRFPINTPDVETNLCMKCHHKRAVPDPDSPRGPHSPQGPLLLGEDAGWRPPNFAYGEGIIAGTHGSDANPRLCAGCHVNRMNVADEATGGFVFNATGHLFNPIPCLDAEGKPTPSKVDCTVEERSFAGCTASGCHGSETAARSAYIVAGARIADLVTELDALLAQVPTSEFSTTDDVFTTAEGAKFNAGLGAITSSAIHNPFLTEALLTASIKQVKLDYGLPSVSSVALEDLLDRPAGGR